MSIYIYDSYCFYEYDLNCSLPQPFVASMSTFTTYFGDFFPALRYN